MLCATNRRICLPRRQILAFCSLLVAFIATASKFFIQIYLAPLQVIQVSQSYKLAQAQKENGCFRAVNSNYRISQGALIENAAFFVIFVCQKKPKHDSYCNQNLCGRLR